MDAWEEYDNLIAANTQEWEVRPDLVVRALAHERAIVLEVNSADPAQRDNWPIKDPPCGSSGPRNIGTMEELAVALLEASDFVKRLNPGWANRMSEIEIVRKNVS